MNLSELRALSGMCQDFEVWEVEGEEPIAYGKNHYMTREFDECEVLNVFASGCTFEVYVERPPKEEPRPVYFADITTLLGQSIAIETDSADDAKKKAEALINNRKFFDERIHARWSYENEWDAAEVTNVDGGWTTDDLTEADNLITQEVIDRYLNGEE